MNSLYSISSKWSFANEYAPPAMATLGDSISAGSLANTYLTGPYSTLENEFPEDFVAPGDDPFMSFIKQRFFSGNKFTLSWATGLQIDSQFVLLNRYLYRNNQRMVMAMNYSLPGGRSDSIPYQASRVYFSWLDGKFSSLKYVTLMIGANDVCNRLYPNGTPLASMRADIMQGLKILSLIKQKEPIRILIQSIPNVAIFGSKNFKIHPALGGFANCGYVQNQIMNYCNNMVNWQTASGYASKVNSIEQRVNMLKELSQEMMRLRPNLDIQFLDFFFQHSFEPRNLAMDCFHPNADSQQNISKITWQKQKWFK